jgi:hypothetical protein
MMKITVGFRNFANVPKKFWNLLLLYEIWGSHNVYWLWCWHLICGTTYSGVQVHQHQHFHLHGRSWRQQEKRQCQYTCTSVYSVMYQKTAAFISRILPVYQYLSTKGHGFTSPKK